MDWLFRGFMFGIGAAVAVSFVVALLTHNLSGRFDATDDAANHKRSGLGIMRDHGTGREYLVSPFGAITPRLPADPAGAPPRQQQQAGGKG